MRGSKRPADERARAVGLAVVVGQEEAGRQLGIPKQTIHDWMNRPEFVQLRTTARETVGELMWVTIQKGLEQIDTALEDPKERLRDKADAVQMLIEKRALLMGEPTARSEVTTFRDYNDHERQALSELADRLLEEGPETTAGGVEEGVSSEVR